jgi:hypothetical protein
VTKDQLEQKMNDTPTTVVIAQAIKTHFWEDVYKSFKGGNSPFQLIFVGHIKPNFKLPPNMIWVECSLSPAKCAEIAYRYAYKHFPGAKYIVNIADDLLIPPAFLKDNIEFYERQKKKLGVDILLTGPICLVHPQTQIENLMAWKNGGPNLLVTNFTEIKTSKKIGGIDNRFEGIYWDCDRMLRAHEMGGKVIVASSNELSPIREREHLPGLHNKYKSIDKTFLDKLWIVTENGGKLTNCCSLNNKKNVFSEKLLSVKRTDEVIQHTEEKLGKYYEFESLAGRRGRVVLRGVVRRVKEKS